MAMTRDEYERTVVVLLTSSFNILCLIARQVGVDAEGTRSIQEQTVTWLNEGLGLEEDKEEKPDA